jgi:hypothetical protein
MFEAHGSFELAVRGNILQANIIGGWNVESAQQYSEAIKEITKPLFGKPWAIISVMDEWELFTPDCEPIIKALSAKAYQSGLVREAMVNRIDSIKMQPFHAEIRGAPLFERQFHSTIEEAITWLKSEGFSLT